MDRQRLREQRGHCDLAALGVRLDVSPGPEAALRAVLGTPLGHMTLR
ncbi:hypothetical protein [Nonomuraea sp. CA-141351]